MDDLYLDEPCSSCARLEASWSGAWSCWYCTECCARRSDAELYHPDLSGEALTRFVRFGRMNAPDFLNLGIIG